MLQSAQPNDSQVEAFNAPEQLTNAFVQSKEKVRRKKLQVKGLSPSLRSNNARGTEPVYPRHAVERWPYRAIWIFERRF